MTKQDLLEIFHSQIEQYQSKTNKVVMMLTDPTGPHIYVESIDKLEELAHTLAQYAYTNPGETTIPRFTHLTCIDNNNDSE